MKLQKYEVPFSIKLDVLTASGGAGFWILIKGEYSFLLR